MYKYFLTLGILILILIYALPAYACDSCSTCGPGCHKIDPKTILCCMPKEDDDDGGSCGSGCHEDFPGHCSCSTDDDDDDSGSNPLGFAEGWSNCSAIIGWAFDNDETQTQSEIDIEIYLNDKTTKIATGKAIQWRSDINNYAGFNIDVSGKIPSGTHKIYTKGLNVGGGDDQWLGCWSSNNNPSTPSQCDNGALMITCVAPTPTPTPTLTATPTLTPTMTPTPIPAWYKLKSTSLHKKNTVNITIPSSMQLYDPTDDTLDQYPLIGDTGLVTTNATTMTITSQSMQVSKYNWRKSVYTPSHTFLNDLSLFVTYAKTKNKVHIITDINNMQSDVINIIPNNYTIDNVHQIPSSINNSILIVQGDLQIHQHADQRFNPNKLSRAIIVTGELKIHSNYTELNGIFIADKYDFAYDIGPNSFSTNPLKINGNLISHEQISAAQLKRKRTNTNQPTLFIVLNPSIYIDLIPLLSTISFEGRQIK